MKLFGLIEKVEPLDDGTIKIHGIASTESVDDQGETVKAEAMRAAIPDYMRFPAVREMHQLQAAGTALEADVGTDNVTRIVAHIVDPVAVSKVKNQVYRGFSIGGRVTKREAGNPKTITGLVLNEISLVDRPANPEAIYDVWKASMAGPPTAAAGAAASFNPPIQIWSCGDTTHHHLAKTDAISCLEKRSQQDLAEPLTGDEATHLQEALHKTGEPPAEAAAADDPAAPIAEITKRAGEGANAAQTAIDAAIAAIDAGTVALAPPVAKAAGATDGDMAAKDGDDGDMADASKGGDAPGDGSKPYGDVKYADPGHQSDGKKRYPIDTADHIRAAWSYINQSKNAGKYSAKDLASVKAKIVSAWKAKIDKDGPPSASEKASLPELAKSLWDIGDVAMMVGSLRSLHQRLALEAAMENDDSSLPATARDLCAQLCEFLVSMVAEETQEVLDGTEIQGPVAPMGEVALSIIAESLRKSIPDQPKAEALVTSLYKAGAKHNARDQALLDVAAGAMHKAMNMASCTKGDRMHLGDAMKAVLDEGATNLGADGREMLTDGTPVQGAGAATQHSTVDTSDNAETTAPNPTGASPASPMPAKVDKSGATALAIIEALLTAPGRDVEKAGTGHKPLMEIAHQAIAAVADGATCKADGAKPSRHSGATMANLDKAHFHITKCEGMAMVCKAANELPGGSPPLGANAGESEGQGASEDTSKAAAAATAGEPMIKAEASQVVAEANPALEQLIKTTTSLTELVKGLVNQNQDLRARVEDIAQTPLPARALARAVSNATGLTKSQDGGLVDSQTGPVDVTDALAQMSDEDVTKTLIKRSFRKPLVVRGFTDGPGPMRAVRA